MARSQLQKALVIEDSVLMSAARVRRRALLILHGALKASGFDQVKLAKALGLKKSAVSAALNGNGNLSLNTLAEYMGAMGFEVDLVATALGEVEAAQAEHRSPKYIPLTVSDRARLGRQVGVLTPQSYSSEVVTDRDWLAVFASGALRGEANRSVYTVLSKDGDSEPVTPEQKVKIWSSKS